MQNDLKNLLKLLEKSFNTHDSSELQSLEKEIDKISSNIKNTISSSENIDYQLNDSDISGIFDKLGNVWDEPFSDLSQVPTLILSRITRNEVKVALSGDGGDELFCGYNRYNFGYKLFKTFQKYPTKLKYLFSNLLKIFPSNYLDRYLGKLFSLGNIESNLSSSDSGFKPTKSLNILNGLKVPDIKTAPAVSSKKSVITLGSKHTFSSLSGFLPTNLIL